MTRLTPGFSGSWGGPWIDSDGGGAADLQTDVMRFMAILALCLVAIFALVQAVPPAVPTEPLPVEPLPVEPLPVEPLPTEPLRTEPLPVEVLPTEALPAEPLPTRSLPAAPSPAETGAVRAVPVTAPPTAAPPAPTAAPPATEATAATAGFTLRFESDVALKSLVARNEIGLYAIYEGDARRLQLMQGRLEFWPASMPSTFHEMDPQTVPGDVAAALARTGHGGEGAGGPAVRWGVTLPPQLSREIDRRVGRGGAGDLVIAASGVLREE